VLASECSETSWTRPLRLTGLYLSCQRWLSSNTGRSKLTNELFDPHSMLYGMRVDFSPPSISMRMGVGLDCLGD
jgi:hypothetical protein